MQFCSSYKSDHADHDEEEGELYNSHICMHINTTAD